MTSFKKIKLKDWDLIPKYSVDSEEDIEPLDEGFKYDIGLGLGEIKDNSFFEIAFIPIYHKDNFHNIFHQHLVFYLIECATCG